MKRMMVFTVLLAMLYIFSGHSSYADNSPSSIQLYVAKEGIYTSEFFTKYAPIWNSYSNYLNIAVSQYCLVNSKWPETWDDLRADYLPYLPVSIWDDETIKLEVVQELPKFARKDKILALIEADSKWLVVVPQMNLEEKRFVWPDDQALQIQRDIRDGGIEAFRDKPQYYSTNMERFGSINRTFVNLQMEASYTALGRMPEGVEEFLVGYEINQKYNYEWNPFEKVGVFKVTIYPDQNSYHYVFNGYQDGHRYGSGQGSQLTANQFPSIWSPLDLDRSSKETEKSYVVFDHTWFTSWVPAVTGKS